jgi:hypothetical protein
MEPTKHQNTSNGHIIIQKKNEVYLIIQAEPHIYYELRDAFQFEVPNAKFAPAYKNKWWDGHIYLFNINYMQSFFDCVSLFFN